MLVVSILVVSFDDNICVVTRVPGPCVCLGHSCTPTVGAESAFSAASDKVMRLAEGAGTWGGGQARGEVGRHVGRWGGGQARGEVGRHVGRWAGTWGGGPAQLS